MNHRILLIAFLSAAILLGASLPVYAADEFGSRFGTTPPQALADAPLEIDGEILQQIEPAAGETTATEEKTQQDNTQLQELDNTVTEDSKTAPQTP